MSAERLEKNKIESRIAELEGWERKKDAIERTFEFDSFLDAISFINQIADLAEDADHHPEIFNVYDTVKLTLTTHDAGGLTQKDFDMAAGINGEFIG